jgi:hypothetical protein
MPRPTPKRSSALNAVTSDSISRVMRPPPRGLEGGTPGGAAPPDTKRCVVQERLPIKGERATTWPCLRRTAAGQARATRSNSRSLATSASTATAHRMPDRARLCPPPSGGVSSFSGAKQRRISSGAVARHAHPAASETDEHYLVSAVESTGVDTQRHTVYESFAQTASYSGAVGCRQPAKLGRITIA